MLWMIYTWLLEYKFEQPVHEDDRCTIDFRDERMLLKTISDLMAQGWRAEEIYSHMKYMEYFDDYMNEEDFCLKMLSETRTIVENRIKNGRDL